MQAVDLRKKTIFAFSSIILFIVSYIILLLLAVALTAACGYLGILIMTFRINMWTILFGLGFIGLGILVLFFLLKFLVHKTTTDLSGMVEVYEKDEPKLFALVRSLAKEIKTDMPKKIYLTADINAAVFYDSSFWSMFLPVRKNLQIGLGLVNSVTESELKAVIAHEFGHFSQRSMKVGSYVYNVNKIIYNMLYDNDGFQSLIDQFANVSNVFALFVGIAIKIMLGIQWILKKLYNVVNLSYRQLSREMEFHADEIAARTAGSQPLIDSLMRLEFAESAYQDVINFYNDHIAYNKKTANIYPQHQLAMQFSAKHFKLDLQHNLPLVTQDKISRFNKSRLVIKDQWASHPTTEERVQRLRELNIPAEQSHASAWNYFNGADKLQQIFTDKLFENVNYAETPESLELPVFHTLFEERLNKYTFDKRYQEIYANKDIAVFDIQHVLSHPEDYKIKGLEDIFNEASLDLLHTHRGLISDVQLLEQLQSAQHDIKSFDFDGKKYKIKEVGSLIEELQKEKKAVEESVTDIDRKSFTYFYNLAEESETLKDKYEAYFLISKSHTENVEIYQKMAELTQFINYTATFDDIRMKLLPVYDLEIKLKAHLKELLQEELAEAIIDPEARKKAEEYLRESLKYFNEPHYNDRALGLLFNAQSALLTLSTDKLFRKKKEVLTYQMELLKA